MQSSLPAGPRSTLSPSYGAPKVIMSTTEQDRSTEGVSITWRTERGVLIGAMEGQLVVSNRQQLKMRVLDEIESGARKFCLDLGACGYIDTTGLGVLVSIAKRIRDAGGALVLCGMNDDLKTLFSLTKMESLFVISDTLERALEHLAQ
jgi:anti-anti-sigma factor